MSVLKYYRIAFSKNPSKILRRVFECIICLVSRRFTAKCIQLPYTVLVLIKLTKFAVALRLRIGSCKLIFLHYFTFFAKFTNVVHSNEPGETPSNSASHLAPNYVQRS